MKANRMMAKRSLLGALKFTGAFHSLAESQWRNGKLLILCYHGVSLEDEHEWRPTSFMTDTVFESRLKMLHSGGYSVLPLEEALSKLYSNTLPRKSVVITFDDGLYNFYAKAFPLLKKYNFPSTLYLTSYYCRPQLPVFPLCVPIFYGRNRGQRVIPAIPTLGLQNELDLTTAAAQDLVEDQIRDYVGTMSWNAVQKNEYLKRLAAHLELDFDGLNSKRLFHLVNEKEVKELSQNGVDIQLHTHRHRTAPDRTSFQQEIIENRSAIKELTGHEAQHHCYPSGVYRREFLPWLSEVSVASATTCDHDLANAKTNQLLLPRFLDSSNVSAIEFESWITGVAPFLRHNFHVN